MGLVVVVVKQAQLACSQGVGGREGTGHFDCARTPPALTARGIVDSRLASCLFLTSTAREARGLNKVRRT